jgi:hypothetical protein
MYDYAQVQLLGRATSDAVLSNLDDEGRPGAAFLTLALNIPIRRGNQTHTKTLYRRIMVLSSFASYVAKCQDEGGGLKGRLVNALGVMDDERYYDDEDNESYRDIVRVAPGAGQIKVMDRRTRNDG